MTNRFPPKAHHVLSFAQSLKGGGVERALLRLADGWVARGRRVTLLIGDASGPLAAELPAEVETVAAGSGRYGDLMRAAARAGGLEPDVIFCPGNHYSAIALAARPFVRVPIVAKVSNALAQTHGGLTGWGYRRWLALHPHFIDHLVAMTPAMAAEAAALMRFAPDRIDVIPNPPAQPITGATPVAPPAGRYILGVGRLEPQKRWDRLIAALPKLADQGVSLVILGEGRERAALTELAVSLGIAGRVHLPGHAADPIPAMAGAQLLALTSDHEGVPGVIREALAEGTPVVSTDSSVAIPELIASPSQGDIVGREDAAALIAAINRWLAPGVLRPAPIRAEGDPVGDYLDLFDRLVAARFSR